MGISLREMYILSEEEIKDRVFSSSEALLENSTTLCKFISSSESEDRDNLMKVVSTIPADTFVELLLSSAERDMSNSFISMLKDSKGISVVLSIFLEDCWVSVKGLHSFYEEVFSIVKNIASEGEANTLAPIMMCYPGSLGPSTSVTRGGLISFTLLKNHLMSDLNGNTSNLKAGQLDKLQIGAMETISSILDYICEYTGGALDVEEMKEGVREKTHNNLFSKTGEFIIPDISVRSVSRKAAEKFMEKAEHSRKKVDDFFDDEEDSIPKNSDGKTLQ